jgi:hypothetical protein
MAAGTAIKLTAFGGMVPAVDERLLPETGAAQANNVWLYSGALEGIREPLAVYTCQQARTKRAFRIPYSATDRAHLQNAYWLEFPYEDVDVIKGPVADDRYDRYYWTSVGTGPQYNPLLRIIQGYAPLTLGVPYPTTFPGVIVGPSPVEGTIYVSLDAYELPDNSSAGSTPEPPVVLARSYVYTYVTDYGEESAPSAPGTGTGGINDVWRIVLVPPTDAQKLNRKLDKTRIYRTITSSAGVATYFLVDEVNVDATTYADNKSDAELTANAQLEPTTWTPPPSDLAGFASMPNGMIVGFRSNEIWFCEPYRPHAWPSIYTLTVPNRIVGIGVTGQTAIICTEIDTWAATGTHPSVISLARVSMQDPCLSRATIVPVPSGVAYASPNGLVVATAGAVVLATRGLFNRTEWRSFLNNKPTIRAAALAGGYYLFGTVLSGGFNEDAFSDDFMKASSVGAKTGGLFDASDVRVGFTNLSSATDTTNVYNDPWTNETFVLRAGVVYQILLSPERPRSEYVWRSKKFQLPKQHNLGAVKLYFDTPTEAVGALGTIKVWADDRLVATKSLTKSGAQMRLPSGFKAEFWQIEITSKAIISSVQLGAAARELANV